MQVSVVIPTYRRNDLLAACLTKVLAQDFAGEYEVIVCDDGPTEETAKLVGELASQAKVPLRYVPVTATQGPAGARNAGWRMAAGEIIAFTDDDCLPESGWLAAGVAALTAADADAVTGRTIVPLPADPTDYERNVAGLATAEFITANCFVRRAALEAVGGFDERFTLAWREDSDLHFSLLSRGFTIATAAEAVVVHPIRPAPWGISLKQQRQGLFDPLLYRKHPQIYRERIPQLPRLYYAAAAALVGTAAGIILQQPTLAAVSAIAWVVLTGLFAYRRLQSTSRRWPHVLEMIYTSAIIPIASLYWRVRGALRFGAFHF
jgi:glycosyltransferase involved in cell wall biosynthesis